MMLMIMAAMLNDDADFDVADVQMENQHFSPVGREVEFAAWDPTGWASQRSGSLDDDSNKNNDNEDDDD